MSDISTAVIKAISPKILVGGLLGLPVTAVVSPALGLVFLAGASVICAIGFGAAVRYIHSAQDDKPVSPAAPVL